MNEKAGLTNENIEDLIVIKIMNKAEEQFWERIKRSIRLAVISIIALVGVLGLSGWITLPKIVKSILTTEVKDTLSSDRIIEEIAVDYAEQLGLGVRNYTLLDI